jgi:hypothetical protein
MIMSHNAGRVALSFLDSSETVLAVIIIFREDCSCCPESFAVVKAGIPPEPR